MLRWETIATDHAEDGGELVLARRGDDWSVRTRGRVLMTNRTGGSEVALAELALKRLERRRSVMVGGLGLGYTLRAVLDRMPVGGKVVLVEFSAALVEWNRGPVAHLAGRPLDDPRVRLQLGDVKQRIAEARGAYDAILLDVDNGPTPLVRAGNAALYSDAGVRSCLRALAPGGVLAVWSAGHDETYLARLRRFADDAEARTVHPARGGNRHVIFLATRERTPGPGRRAEVPRRPLPRPHRRLHRG
jgi:spermidine synthase